MYVCVVCSGMKRAGPTSVIMTHVQYKTNNILSSI